MKDGLYNDNIIIINIIKCAKKGKVAHKAHPSVSLMFLHFDIFCDLLLCRVTQHGIYLFYMIKKQDVVDGDVVMHLSSNRS